MQIQLQTLFSHLVMAAYRRLVFNRDMEVSHQAVIITISINKKQDHFRDVANKENINSNVIIKIF